MSTSTPQFVGRLSLVGALSAGLLFAACADTPTAPDTLPSEPSLDHAGNHPASAGNKRGKVTASFLQQPTLRPHPVIVGLCLVDYSFEIAGKGPEQLVRWSTYVNDSPTDLGSSTETVGSKLGAATVAPTIALPDDGTPFVLNVEVTDDTRSVLHAEIASDVTVASCT